MSQSTYNADALEVLSGLDPVRRRPGMYTDTTRPNHLAQEVIDNSVDEALAGHARTISVVLHQDNALEVSDDGRGMPVDIHPEEGVSGVELILTRLHAGGKFSNKNYQFSGGLHGVGISVVNALSHKVEVRVKRDGQEYAMAFANGDKVRELEVIGTVGKRNTGTTVTFWPDAKYFDSAKFSITRLKHLLKAKAVLCPGLKVDFDDRQSGEKISWCYEDGLRDYLVDACAEWPKLPEEPFSGAFAAKQEAVDWAVFWLPEGGELVQESYVNLIPTAQGGTHVNGLRAGLLEAIREFCERIGVTRSDGVVDMGVLEFCIRDDLDANAPRAMCVLKPLKVTITNYPEGQTEELRLPRHPKQDIGERVLPFEREIYIDREDYMIDPPKGYKRLVPGGEVRLRGSYVIRADEAITDADGNIVELLCSYDPDTLGKNPEGRKVKGVIHWVPASSSIECEVRLYDRLFNAANPDKGEEGTTFLDNINPDSLQVLSGCRAEPSLAEATLDDRFQFEREGYFCVDSRDSKAGAMVFNRTVTLRDSWGG